MNVGSPGLRGQDIQNLKANQNLLSPKISKQVKLNPIKNRSAIIDPEKNKQKLAEIAARAKPNSFNEKNDVDDSSKVDSFDHLSGSLTSSKQSRRNRRYSNTVLPTDSITDPNFKIMDDTVEINLYDQLNKSIIDGTMDINNRMYVQGSNGRKISIIGIKSPERTSKKCVGKNSEDQAMYQASTVCSNALNKSSKKSGFKFSRDFFSFSDDEVNHERTNKNKEILNLLSESDFEQIKKAIENDYQKASKDLTKNSGKQPFSS